MHHLHRRVGRDRSATWGSRGSCERRAGTNPECPAGGDGWVRDEQRGNCSAATNRPQKSSTAPFCVPVNSIARSSSMHRDLDGREAILKVHASRKKAFRGCGPSPSWPQPLRECLARTLPMCSMKLPILTARRKANAITQRDLEQAVEKLVAGPERRSRRLNERRQAARRLSWSRPRAGRRLQREMPILSTRSASFLAAARHSAIPCSCRPKIDSFSRAQSLMERLAGLLGGRAAEEIGFRRGNHRRSERPGTRYRSGTPDGGQLLRDRVRASDWSAASSANLLSSTTRCSATAVEATAEISMRRSKFFSIMLTATRSRYSRRASRSVGENRGRTPQEGVARCAGVLIGLSEGNAARQRPSPAAA